MGRTTFRWNNPGFYAIRRDPNIVAILEEIGENIQDECNSQLRRGAGYELTSRQGAKKPYGRWHVRVYTQTWEAMEEDARNHLLDRALGNVTL
jgi:hypothetical protein